MNIIPRPATNNPMINSSSNVLCRGLFIRGPLIGRTLSLGKWPDKGELLAANIGMNDETFFENESDLTLIH